MFGLIKKDLLMIKSNFKIMAALLLAYSVMTFQGEMDIYYMISFMSVIMMMSTFSYDAYNKWDAYAVTLPNGRKNIVRAKYLVTLLLIIVMSISVTILDTIISYIRTNSFDIENILSMMLGSVFATTIVRSLMYPSIYKFGVEKARIGIFIIVFGVTIIGGILFKYIDPSTIINALSVLDTYWLIIIPASIVLILYISYVISKKIYNQKEY